MLPRVIFSVCQMAETVLDEPGTREQIGSRKKFSERPGKSPKNSRNCDCVANRKVLKAPRNQHKPTYLTLMLTSTRTSYIQCFETASDQCAPYPSTSARAPSFSFPWHQGPGSVVVEQLSNDSSHDSKQFKTLHAHLAHLANLAHAMPCC